MTRELTDKETRILHDAWVSHETNMGDPWRNDFSDDGQGDDERRREEKISDICDQIPDLSRREIEELFDNYR